MFSPNKILVPTDFSRFSDQALQKAIDIAEQYKSQIHVLHVTRVAQRWPTGYSLNLEVPTIEEYEAASVELAHKLIEEQINKLNGNKTLEIFSKVAGGRPYKEIVTECEKNNIDLIVICSHGRTGIVSQLIGSVALQVAQHAPCHVLIVRGN